MKLTNISISRPISYGLIIFSLIGWLDAVYLTAKHYTGQLIICPLTGSCSDVLNSQYSILFGLPTALWGSIYYFIILVSALIYLHNKIKIAGYLLLYFTVIGFIVSVWMVYLQIAVINSLCLYCLISAASSTILFILSFRLLLKRRRSQL